MPQSSFPQSLPAILTAWQQANPAPQTARSVPQGASVVPSVPTPSSLLLPSVGSVADIAARIISTTPKRWFIDTKRLLFPVVSAIIYGSATALSWVHALNGYVANQTRRVTTSDLFLDLGLFDFFGLRVRRKPAQPDASVRATWQNEVLRRRNTRAFVQQAVQDLTGTPVTIFEAFNPMDTGGFGVQWAFNEPACAWGSSGYPYTMFINAVQPIGTGIPNLSGLNNAQSGFASVGSQFALADLSLTTGAVTNQDIYDMINSTRSAGITCWVNIGPAPVVGGRLNSTFTLGVTPLS